MFETRQQNDDLNIQYTPTTDLESHKKVKVIYKVELTDIKGFTYKTPLVSVDDNGELSVSYSKDKETYIHAKKVTFLNLVGYELLKIEEVKDKEGNVIDRKPIKGKVVSYEPMDHVNQFILSKHIEEGKEESNQLSKGLLHYFDFILSLQDKWDEEYGEDYDPILTQTRPAWDSFASRKHQRATYMYHKALKDSVSKGQGLAKTTAAAYMRAVVNFYKFHLRHGVRFNNPPFEFEIVKLHFEGSSSSMKSYLSKDVHTTDLRLNFPKSKMNQGGSLPNARKELRPLSNVHWKEVETILTKTKRVRKNVKGIKKNVSLAEEYCLFFLLLRFTGLRKEEGSSLHLGQIFKPDLTKPMLRLGVGAEYSSLTKGKDGENKSRRTIIPTSIMHALYEYTKSKRYKKRLAKFQELCEKKRDEGDDAFFDSVDGVDPNKQYLFLSQSGIPFFNKLTELNNRWSEVRETVSHNLGIPMEDTIHNLRSTFAVALFRMLLKAKDSETALAIVSEFLGHEDLATTLLYLKIAEDHPTGDEIWEDIIDYLDVFNDVQSQLLTDPILPESSTNNA